MPGERRFLCEEDLPEELGLLRPQDIQRGRWPPAAEEGLAPLRLLSAYDMLNISAGGLCNCPSSALRVGTITRPNLGRSEAQLSDPLQVRLASDLYP